MGYGGGSRFCLSQLATNGCRHRPHFLPLFITIHDKRTQFLRYLFFSRHSFLRVRDFLFCSVRQGGRSRLASHNSPVRPALASSLHIAAVWMVTGVRDRPLRQVDSLSPLLVDLRFLGRSHEGKDSSFGCEITHLSIIKACRAHHSPQGTNTTGHSSPLAAWTVHIVTL